MGGTLGRSLSPTRTFWVCVVASLFVHGALAAVHLGFLHGSRFVPLIADWSRTFVETTPSALEQHRLARAVTQSGWVRATVFVSLVATLWGLFFGCIHALSRGARVRLRWLVVVGAAFLTPYVAALPTLSHDAFAYLAWGEIADSGTEKPYDFELEKQQGRPLAGLAPGRHSGSIYGPLATRMFTWCYQPTWSIYANVLLLRGALVSLWLGSVVLLCWGLKSRGPAPGIHATIAYFALNPLAVIEIGWNVHLDALAVFICAIGTALLLKGVSWGAIVIGSLSSVRASFLFLWPAVVAFFSRKSSRRINLVGGLIAVSALVVFSGIWLLPNWVSRNPLAPVLELSKLSGATLPYVLKTLGREFGVRGWITAAFLNLFCLVVFFLRAWRLDQTSNVLRHLAEDFLLYFLVFMPWTHPWYFVTGLPLVLASGSKSLLRVFSLATVGMSLAFYAADLSGRGWGVPDHFGVYVLGLLPASLFLIFHFRSRREPRAPLQIGAQ